MSWLSSAWAETAPVADVYERAIITLLAHRSRSDGTGAYPSAPSMAKFAVCDERSIKRRLEALRRRGVIAYGDQRLAAHIDSRYRPKVYDLLIPISWYSAAQLEQVNRDRAERGLGPLTEDDRPPIADPPPSRKGRSDIGSSRSRRPVHDETTEQQSAPERQGGLLVTPGSVRPGVTSSPAQGCLVVPPRGDYETPKTVFKENLSVNHPPPAPPDQPEPEHAGLEPVEEEAHAVLNRVNSAALQGRMGRHQLAQLTPAVAGVLRGGVWTSAALGEHLAANLTGAKSAYSVTRFRLDDLPDTAPATGPARPRWCGTCDEHTRHREGAEGKTYRCPDCHPLATSGGRAGHVDVAPLTGTATRAAKAVIAAKLTAARMRRCGSAQRRHAAASTTSFGEGSGAIQQP